MRDVSATSCTDFQKIFFHDGVLSPYEFVEWHPYFTVAALGEVGTLINNYCKQKRSPNDYSGNLINECADIFVFFTHGLLYINESQRDKIVASLEVIWRTQPTVIANDADLIRAIIDLESRLHTLILAKPSAYTGKVVCDITELIKSISHYLTGLSWQQVINKFHVDAIEEHTNFRAYTPDLYYKGSSRLDFSLLLNWIDCHEVAIPPKRLLFLKRLAKMQGVMTWGLHPTMAK